MKFRALSKNMCELMLGIFTEASPSVFFLQVLQNAGVQRPAPFQIGAEEV